MAISLRATLQDNASGLMIELPAEAVDQLGAGKRPAIKAVFNGSYEYRQRISVYGGRYYLGLRKDVREATGLQPGETVDLTLELDEEPREVALPPDLAAILDNDPEAKDRFDQLSFTNRKEYVVWVTSAKKAETHQRRLVQVASLLKSGKKTPL